MITLRIMLLKPSILLKTKNGNFLQTNKKGFLISSIDLMQILQKDI